MNSICLYKLFLFLVFSYMSSIKYAHMTKILFIGYFLYCVATRPCFNKHSSLWGTITCMYEEFELILCYYVQCILRKICNCCSIKSDNDCHSKSNCYSVKKDCDTDISSICKMKYKLKKCLTQFIQKILADYGIIKGQPMPMNVHVLNSQSTNYNVLLSDEIIEIGNIVEINVNLLPVLDYKGRELTIIKTSNNNFKINIVPIVGNLIDGIIGNSVYLNDQFQRITLLSNGSNTYYIL